MPQIPFTQMPPHARLWIFSADRPLDAHDRETILETADAFLDSWAAHGAPLTSARALEYDRFLLVAVDEQAAGVSGCSIDALVHALQDVERKLGLKLLDHAPVSYRENGSIKRVSRAEFSELAESGAVTQQTTVFDNTVQSIADVRNGKWETAASESWHGKVFFPS